MVDLALVGDVATAVKFRTFAEAAAALRDVFERFPSGVVGDQLIMTREAHLVSSDGGIGIRVYTIANRVLWLGTAETVASRRLAEARRGVTSWQSLQLADGEIARPEDAPGWPEYVAASEAFAVEVARRPKSEAGQ